ncbi:hypothetical protein ENBRE01_2260 [Enteropsectra breve]|nr:hypothetical protein ENBRE01_2260 [Enteropsectra breve]
MARKNKVNEDVPADEDFSSEDMDTYVPSGKESGLEVDERAYKMLEYINLEWPAQSIAVIDSQLYLGTNPDMESGNPVMELIAIDLSSNDFENLKHRESRIDKFVNKLRINKKIFALADNSLSSYSLSLGKIKSLPGDFGYGLFVTDEHVFAGTFAGSLHIYDHDLNLISNWQLHGNSIEAIAVENNLIYTASVDKTVKITDMEGKCLKTIENEAEINCLDVRNGKIIYGDDDGMVHLVDTETEKKETISWHQSSVAAVQWRDNDIFASCSDEQLCLWDISLEEEWDYHKYLLFVHQGQEFYKDIAFDGDKVITTALDGLCVFVPVSFEEAA